MWINNNISYPLKDKVYRTLVAIDDFDTLEEHFGKFEGGDWCHYESCRQFIRYWWSDDDHYEKIQTTLC